jgi:hypothetical protein
VSFTWQGKSQSQFVRRAEVPTVRQQVRNYQRLRTLVDTWVGVAMELSRLRLQEARGQPRKITTDPARFWANSRRTGLVRLALTSQN